MKHLFRVVAATAMTLSAIHPSPAEAATDGKAVFERNCAVCHTMQPPPKNAPPVRGIASRYQQQFTSREKGVAHMKAFIASPSRESAVMAKASIDRFGMMPPMGMLSDDELTAVAAWIWDQGVSGRGSKGMQGSGGNCR